MTLLDALDVIAGFIRDGGEMLLCAEDGEWMALTSRDCMDQHVVTAVSPETAITKLAQEIAR